MRAVDEYVVHPWGLYMARPTPGRVQFHYLESWLLPSVGIRANVFHFNPGYEREQDYYLDIGDVTAGDDRLAHRGPLHRSGRLHRATAPNCSMSTSCSRRTATAW